MPSITCWNSFFLLSLKELALFSLEIFSDIKREREREREDIGYRFSCKSWICLDEGLDLVQSGLKQTKKETNKRPQFLKNGEKPKRKAKKNVLV